MLSAKYITHTLEKLDTSKFSEVFRNTDILQSAHTSLQAKAIDPTSLLLSPDKAPGAQGRIPTCCSSNTAAPKWATELCMDVDGEDANNLC